jgi:uncharacterized Zn ribbon protein
MRDVLTKAAMWECVTCGHEWEKTEDIETPPGPRVFKDAHGNVLNEGDVVVTMFIRARRVVPCSLMRLKFTRYGRRYMKRRSR